MYCEKCGFGLSTSAEFCPKCGHDVRAIAKALRDQSDNPSSPAAASSALSPTQKRQAADTRVAASASAPAIRPAETTPSNPLACPHCGQTDQVQKVTSVVEQSTVDSVTHSVGSGSATTIGYGGGGMFLAQTSGGSGATSYGGSQTRLGQRLSPPGEPTKVKVWGWGMVFGILAIPILVMILLAIIQVRGGVAFLLFLIGTIGIAWYWIRSKMNDKSRIEAGYAQEHPRWEKAARRWLDTFYCFRCDGVFTPGRDKFVPTSQMNDYLYE